jgi:hypothetical protein
MKVEDQEKRKKQTNKEGKKERKKEDTSGFET